VTKIKMKRRGVLDKPTDAPKSTMKRRKRTPSVEEVDFTPVEKGYMPLPLNKVIKADWNYKTEDDELKEKLKKNMELHGQIENILVRQLDENVFECVNGNHRVDALNEIGKETVFCFNLGVMSKASAMRIAVETNETKFSTDNIRLAEVIKEVLGEIDITSLVDTMPFSEDELNGFNELLDFDWENLGNENEGGDGDGGESSGNEIIDVNFSMTPEQYQTWAKWQQVYYEGGSEFDGDASVALIRALELAIEKIEGAEQ